MMGLVGRVPVWVRVGAAVVIAVAATWLFVRWLAGPDALFIDVATGVSGLGTCAAAVVVAWQAIMTRQAVQAAKTSADLSRESADLSKELIAEAVKTRLDARAPSTSLVMKDPAQWPPYEPSDVGEAQPIALGRQYRVPKDANEQIQVRAYLWLTNHSSKPLVVSLSDVVPAGWNEQAPPPQTIEILPGDAEPLLVIQTRSVQSWIEVAESRRSQQFIETVGRMSFSDEFDDGVIDCWSAVLAGSPLRPVKGLGSTWEILPKANDDPSGFEIVHCAITGMERIYYLSKRRNVRLSAITETPGTPA